MSSVPPWFHSLFLNKWILKLKWTQTWIDMIRLFMYVNAYHTLTLFLSPPSILEILQIAEDTSRFWTGSGYLNITISDCSTSVAHRWTNPLTISGNNLAVFQQQTSLSGLKINMPPVVEVTSTVYLWKTFQYFSGCWHLVEGNYKRGLKSPHRQVRSFNGRHMFF